jgi:putative peptidoglycan lipid II flippase
MRKAIVQLFGGNLISKILGLLREILVASLFGTGQINGAYRIAQTGTLVPINFLTSDSLNSAFIPLYKLFSLQSKNKAQTLVWGILFLFLVFSGILVAMSVIFTGSWIRILAPGLDNETAKLTFSMLRIMSFVIPFYLLSALLNYISMANNDFLPMSIRPSIQNAGMLLGAVFAYYLKNSMYLAWGFTISYVFFSIWTFFRAYKLGSLAFPEVFEKKLSFIVIREFWLTLRPLLLLPIVLQGNIAIERATASLISLSAISAIDYARFITETILSILSIPIAFAALTSWSGKSPGYVSIELVKIYKLLVVISIPISAFLGIYAQEIITVIFSRGAFGQESIKATSNILVGMSFGLWAQVVGYIMIKGLNAQLKSKTVLLIMIFSLIANAAINLSFYKILGETTLGLGFSVYGFVMLLGSLYVLKIFHQIISFTLLMFGGSVFYCLICYFIKIQSGNKFIDLLFYGVFFIFYWLVLCLTLTPLREQVIYLYKNKTNKG